jgi:hypothetical protein
MLGLKVGGLRDPLLIKALPELKQHALTANPSENAAIWRATSANWRTRVGGGEEELLKVLRTVRVVEPAVVDRANSVDSGWQEGGGIQGPCTKRHGGCET